MGTFSVSLAATTSSTVVPLTPDGRVQDIEEWLRLSSESFQKASVTMMMDVAAKDRTQAPPPPHPLGTRPVSLLEYTGATDVKQLHQHERYAVLSHGTQDDPIFCYANRAALQQFGYAETEFFRIPSRYSAPEQHRQQRQQVIEKTADQTKNSSSSSGFTLTVIPEAIRMNKSGEWFRIRNVLYFNVISETESQQRLILGQTAVFDCDAIEPVIPE
jgi:hypothetical protein